MMTRNFPLFRILPVWLVLFAFLGGMILPSVAIARVEIAIATEGDPDDGLDSAGGGGGNTESGENLNILDSNKWIKDRGFLSYSAGFEIKVYWVVWTDNQLEFILVFSATNSSNLRIR